MNKRARINIMRNAIRRLEAAERELTKRATDGSGDLNGAARSIHFAFDILDDNSMTKRFATAQRLAFVGDPKALAHVRYLISLINEKILKEESK